MTQKIRLLVKHRYHGKGHIGRIEEWISKTSAKVNLRWDQDAAPHYIFIDTNNENEHWEYTDEGSMNMPTSWEEIAKQKGLSEDFMREYKDILDWSLLCTEQSLSEDFMEEMQAYIHWYVVSYFQTLSEDFMITHMEHLHKSAISECQTLSEAFIETYQDQLNWKKLSLHQTLSEDFIKRFSDKVHWESISTNQSLSYEFMKEHLPRLNFSVLKHNKNVSIPKEKMENLEKEHIEYWKQFISFQYNPKTNTILTHFNKTHFPHTIHYEKIILTFKIIEDYMDGTFISVDFTTTDVTRSSTFQAMNRDLFANQSDIAIFYAVFNDYLITKGLISKPLSVRNKADMEYYDY